MIVASIAYILEDVFLPISIVVILPVMIVWLVTRITINRDNKRTAVLTEAIKNNVCIDADKLIEAMQKPRNTQEHELHRYLLRGSVFTLLGIASAIMCIVFDYQGEGRYFLLGTGLFLAIGIGYLVAFGYSLATARREAGQEEE